MIKCIICGNDFNKNETKYRIAVCSEECYNIWHERQKGTALSQKTFDWDDKCNFIWCVVGFIAILIIGVIAILGA
ncbi:MAG: hypothetical protein ACW97V_16980 [Promethearchaeota archaeon]|jgi:hypothetical protein